MSNKLELWNGLDYWKSGEYQVVEERLAELSRKCKVWLPGKARLFRALELTPMEEVRLVILAQNPYGDPQLATGLAFDVGNSSVYPPTMRNILKELRTDVDVIHSGNLKGWAEQGVLLWNVYPSICGKALSHRWSEWEPLTAEIIRITQKRNIVFAAFGNCAGRFLSLVDRGLSDAIQFTHPSPRAQGADDPFLGSRCFSTLNLMLSDLGHGTIDWRL